MSKKLKNTKKMQDKNYLAKDFTSFRNELVRYGKNYFSNQNSDFSEASLGGMFVELAAYVGDSMSFFLDHQFNELNPQLAIEQKNVLSHARNAGVKIIGASPASADVNIFIEVSSNLVDGEYVPDYNSLPTILERTTFNSASGVIFSLTDDLDFSERGPDGQLLASTSVSAVDGNGNPTNFILSKKAQVVSGQIYVESFSFGTAVPFRKISLGQINISEIISIVDSDENVYYEVDFLTQDTAFKRTKNISDDMMEVPSILEVVNASRRFISETNFNTGITTLTFGGGDESLPDNDAIPDPSTLALPLYGRKTFQRFSIDPNSLLRSQTLGVAPANTTLTITYRAGGGISHNVGAEAINSVESISIQFPRSNSSVVSSGVVSSIDVTNPEPATGGLPRQTLSDVRTAIAQSRNQQSRVVTQDDLLARVYSMPIPFGRVFRASLRKSTRNPMATELYVISKNNSGKLTISSDTLKRNLSTYLNEFRLISDAIDVLDAAVINYGVEFSIVVTPEANKSSVITSVTSAIQNLTSTNDYTIDQPLIEADFINTIINVDGVLSLNKLEFFNRSGQVQGRMYSSTTFDMPSNKFKGMFVGPPGSIFELRFAGDDIIGSAE